MYKFKFLNKKFTINRKQQFMFSEETENTVRFDVTLKEQIENLGKRIGQLILKSYKDMEPVMGVYIFAKHGNGKSLLVRNIVENLEKVENTNVLPRMRKQKYTTYPVVQHIDYWQSPEIPIYNSKVVLSDNELLIAEWADNLKEEYYEPNRIEIELLKLEENENIDEKESFIMTLGDREENDGKRKIATIVGYGYGKNLVENLKNE